MADTFEIIELPEPSPWVCYIFPDVMFRPTINNQPNWFHRKMQELAFGVKWVKE